MRNGDTIISQQRGTQLVQAIRKRAGAVGGYEPAICDVPGHNSWGRPQKSRIANSSLNTPPDRRASQGMRHGHSVERTSVETLKSFRALDICQFLSQAFSA